MGSYQVVVNDIHFFKCQFVFKLLFTNKMFDASDRVFITKFVSILDQETFWEHEFTKKEVIDISLHIYVPKGTRMVVRKSTWLHPIVDGHEAMGLTLPKNLAEKTSAHKALSVVIGARNEREKLEKRVAEIKQERGANLVVSHETARKSKSKTKLGK